MSSATCSMVICGDGAVGKSTIIAFFKTNGFEPVYKQTVGVDFYEKNLVIQGSSISLRVWDIGGQSISSNNLQSYVSHADAAMLVYDVTNRESFANLSDWLAKIRKLSPNARVYVVGNKVDLIAHRQVSETQHLKFLNDNNIKTSFFLSGRTGENIVKQFYKVAAELAGIPLMESELAFYDQVLSVHVEKSDDAKEVRNAWANDIEKEDLENERKKKQHESEGCACMLS